MNNKIYLRTNSNIEKQANAYIKVFGGKILKKSFLNQENIERNFKDKKKIEWNYCYLELNCGLKIMIAKYNKNFPKFGYSFDFVIKAKSKEEFLETYEKLSLSNDFKVDYHPTKFNFTKNGVTLTKFYDDFGYAWILEI